MDLTDSALNGPAIITSNITRCSTITRAHKCMNGIAFPYLRPHAISNWFPPFYIETLFKCGQAWPFQFSFESVMELRVSECGNLEIARIRSGDRSVCGSGVDRGCGSGSGTGSAGVMNVNLIWYIRLHISHFIRSVEFLPGNQARNWDVYSPSMALFSPKFTRISYVIAFENTILRFVKYDTRRPKWIIH